jgi:hypothetical protein
MLDEGRAIAEGLGSADQAQTDAMTAGKAKTL